MAKVYIYKNCDTCRKAKKWLESEGYEVEALPIRETPPSKAELMQALADYEGNVKKLFNVSGQDYRAMQLKDRLPTLSDEAALSLLASNGNLVKRPFLVAEAGAHAGFNVEAWSNLLTS